MILPATSATLVRTSEDLFFRIVRLLRDVEIADSFIITLNRFHLLFFQLGTDKLELGQSRQMGHCRCLLAIEYHIMELSGQHFVMLNFPSCMLCD